MIKEKKKITFTHIETVGHGYLKVSLYDLIGFGFDMEKDFTNFSYIDEETHNVYLEQDCDLNTFLKVMSDKGYDVNIIYNYKPTFEPSEQSSFFHLDVKDQGQ
jgi:hypothetical protein